MTGQGSDADAGVPAVLDRAFARAAPWAPAVAACGAAAMALLTAWSLHFYVRIPVDIVSFAESPFLTDVIKLRTGVPVYGPLGDNNSYPYTPGTQALTWALASLFGKGGDVAALRTVGVSYVVAAALLGTALLDLVVRRLLSAATYPHRAAWLVLSVSTLFVLGFHERFNLYTHTLHNDSLALLVCTLGLFLAARFAFAPGRGAVVALALVPAAGFLVKQSLVIWGPLLLAFLVVASPRRVRDVALYLGVAAVALGAALAALRAVGGPETWTWTFGALGGKQVALVRSIQHLATGGLFWALGLFAGGALLARGDRRLAALWAVWAALFGTECYTSGIGWVENHMGPGVVTGTALFLASVAAAHARADAAPVRRIAVCAALVLGLASQGGVRDPRDPVPADLARYVADIDREFADLPAKDVLLDAGTWPYLRDGLVMKDRADPVALHVGMNQKEINHAALADTIARLRAKTYRRVLARAIDTGQSAYDFQDRGSGVLDALRENYVVVRKIPAVAGNGPWWPRLLLAEISVLEPK
mgnify:CR=1 FL=1